VDLGKGAGNGPYAHDQGLPESAKIRGQRACARSEKVKLAGRPIGLAPEFRFHHKEWQYRSSRSGFCKGSVINNPQVPLEPNHLHAFSFLKTPDGQHGNS
jgi:hypothetical protein